MKSRHKETAKLSAAGVLTVLAAGLLVSSLPENSLGKTIKFSVPLLIGIIFAAKIYFKELDTVKQKLNNQEI